MRLISEPLRGNGRDQLRVETGQPNLSNEWESRQLHITILMMVSVPGGDRKQCELMGDGSGRASEIKRHDLENLTISQSKKKP